MILKMEKSDMMISISTRSRNLLLEDLWVLFYRIRICLQEQSWIISVMEDSMQRMKNVLQQLSLQMQMALSEDFQMDIRQKSILMVVPFLKGKDSCCLLLELQ